MKIKNWRPEIVILTLLSFATRLWDVFKPNAIVFDEVYFKDFAAHYLDGHYFFDIHPPLAKLLFALIGHILHLDPSDMLGGTALQLRLLPAIAGALLVPLVWAILRKLRVSRLFSAIGAFLILADNALIVESRFILMDSLLLLCGLSAVYMYLRARDERHSSSRRYMILLASTALLSGAACSIKWTGLTSIMIVLLLWLKDQLHDKTPWSRRIAEVVTIVLIASLVYIGSFWAHFQLLTKSGDGDAFMNDSFQSTLIGNERYNPNTHIGFAEKFIQLNQRMWQANQTLTATHPYGSRWYSWPLEIRPIYYWQGDTLSDGKQGNIYLLGNPLIWWGIPLAVLVGLTYVAAKPHHLSSNTIAALSVTGLAYIINLLPFMGVTRVMFLYHYFFSFIYSILFGAILWDDIWQKFAHHPAAKLILGIAVLLIALAYNYFAPLTYGTPLSPNGLQSHMWLHTWR